MKRKLVAFAALIMSIIITLIGVTGCNIVTTDNQRDMEQVIATVKIDAGVTDTNIYKKDLVMGYLNYGYTYQQYYGYTQEKTIKLLVSNLINNKIMLQYAMKSFNTSSGIYAGNICDTTKDAFDAQRYLTADELVEIKYEVNKALTDLIDSYDEDLIEDLKSDTNTEEVRTVPTNATNFVKELSVDEMKEYNTKFLADTDSSEKYTPVRRQAFLEVIKLFKNNSLLGSNYDGKLTSTTYYQSSFKTQCEAKVLEKFENIYKENARKAYTLEKLNQSFVEKYETQKEWSNKEFAEALGSATAGSPILYSAYGSYGYVYNLLLGADAKLTKEIGEIDANLSQAVKEQKRSEILAKTTVKDLRASWIRAGFDFDYATKKFTGDYTFTTADKSLAFNGEVTWLNPDETENDKKQYSAKATPMSLNEFITFMDNYVYDNVAQTDINNGSDVNILRKVSNTAKPVQYDDKINELLFAYSTDGGSLNKYKGYAIKPPVEGSESEEYVETFANAGRELLGMGDGSYIIVASDYGYHVMFYSQVFTPNYDVLAGLAEGENGLVKYLTQLYGDKNWEEVLDEMIADFNDYEDNENYLYLLLSEVSSTTVNNAYTNEQRRICNENTYGAKKNNVVKYQDRYSDLFGN